MVHCGIGSQGGNRCTLLPLTSIPDMTSSGYRESSSSVLAIGTGGESVRMATMSMRKSDMGCNHMGGLWFEQGQ